MATLKPLGDNVVLKPVAAEEQTKSGLYIPESAKEKPNKGEVVAVGPGTHKIIMEVKPGDIVYYGKYAGDTFKVDGVELTVVQQKSIIAIEA